MKQISLAALYIMNSFNFSIAMQQAQKRRQAISASIGNPIIILGTFKCTRSGCQNSFEMEEELAAHLKAHDECDGKIYYCRICSTHYFRKKDLTAHNKRHIIKKEIPAIDLTPDEPFILLPMPQKTESMADTKIEMHHLLITRMKAAFDLIATAKPITIVEMRFKQAADSYLCQICNIIYKERSPYLRHLLDKHNYTYGVHSATCQIKKAHY